MTIPMMIHVNTKLLSSRLKIPLVRKPQPAAILTHRPVIENKHIIKKFVSSTVDRPTNVSIYAKKVQ